MYSFPTTRWSLVDRAGGGASSQALDRLLRAYLSPLRAHLVLQRRFPPERADDLLQSFVAEKVLERELIADADRQKGRFRTFLLVALDRFVSNVLRNESRRCRSPGGAIGSSTDLDLPDPSPCPADAYELAWARQVLGHAADRTRAECHAAGRNDLWAVFEGRVLLPTLRGDEPVPYDRLVAGLGLGDAETASNLLVTAKRMFARNLRGVVGEYTPDGSLIDDEIGELREVLSRARG